MKIMSCRFSCSGPDFVYHQYGICRMYSEKNPQYFRFHVPCLYPWKWIMLLLSSEASFKSGGSLPWQLTSENLSHVFILCSPSFAYEGSWYTIFSTIFSVGIIGIYGVASRTCYSHFHELLLHTDTVLQAYTLIESLERDVFNERYAVYLYIIDLRTEFDGFRFFTSYDGTHIMTVNADDTVTDLRPSNISFSCTRTFLMMERRFW